MSDATKLISVFEEVERELSAERGAFWLFGLFQRESSVFGAWDFVFSAPWVDSDIGEGYDALFDAFNSRADYDFWRQIAVFQPLDKDNAFIETVHHARKEAGRRELAALQFNGMTFTRAIVIASRLPDASAVAA